MAVLKQNNIMFKEFCHRESVVLTIMTVLMIPLRSYLQMVFHLNQAAKNIKCEYESYDNVYLWQDMTASQTSME